MIKPDTIADRDAQYVVEVAAILNVSEFRLFELAYQDWFGVHGQEKNLESVYMPYIVCGRIPCWLRHFVRKTLQLCDEAGMFLPSLSVNTQTLSAPFKSAGVWSFCIGLCLISMILSTV